MNYCECFLVRESCFRLGAIIDSENLLAGPNIGVSEAYKGEVGGAAMMEVWSASGQVIFLLDGAERADSGGRVAK